MRKTTIITLVLAIGLGVGAWVTLAKPWANSGDLGSIRTLATAFTEDLQFKDFRRASLYHHGLERDRVDIGRAIERLFLIKPELLDLQRFDIKRASIDSTGKRGKTIIETRFKRLNMSDKKEEKQIVLYWIKRDPDCPMGGECAEGICKDEAGATMYKPDKEKQGARSSTSAKPIEKSTETYACDASKPDAWFMNLDSTLESKGYQ